MWAGPCNGGQFAFSIGAMRTAVSMKGTIHLCRELVFLKGICIMNVYGTCIYEGNLYYEGNFMELVFIRGTCIYEGNLYL